MLTLGDAQYDVHVDPSRFRVLVAGRRFGKTYLAILELVLTALLEPQSICWYVAPTYRMAVDIAWDQLKAIVELIAPTKVQKISEGSLTVRFDNQSLIALKGAEDPDALRGRRLKKLVVDEFAWIVKRAWTEVLRPSLADSRGSALFITTPRGFNWAYDLYLRGKQGDQDEEGGSWSSWQFTTLDGGRVSQSEIDEARNELDPKTFRQEFEASFEAMGGRVYDLFTREPYPRGNVDPSVLDDGGPILVGLDFNVNPMSAVIAQRQRWPAGERCVVIDSVELPSSNTEEMARYLKEHYGMRTDEWGERVPRRVVICPDPAGGSRSTTAPLGTTDLTILRRAGFDVRALPSHPAVVDRINNVQAMLCSADNTRRLIVHPRATALVKGLEGMVYKEGTSQPDKTLGLDHITDALGYLLWTEFNLLQSRAMRTRHLAL